MIRHFNISYLLQDAVRLVPWKVIIDYAYISANVEDLAVVYISGTLVGNTTKTILYAKELAQTSLPSGCKYSDTTEIANMIDEKVTGLIMEIHYAENLDLGRVEIICKQATVQDGATYPAGGNYPPATED